MKTLPNHLHPAIGRGLLLLAANLMIASPLSAQSKLPLGSVMGSFNGVSAYSNESSSRESTDYNFAYDRATGTDYNLGLKWQCVEFCNRYYFEKYQKKIRIAGTDAWEYYGTASSRGLVAYPNGGTEPPKPGDILCFGGGAGGFGHVSICISVGSSTLYACQQNVTCTTRDANFPHTIVASNGRYTVSGSSLGSTYVCQGWLRVPSSKPVPSVVSSPANRSTLAGDRQTFTWNAASGALEYWIYLGTSVGANDLYGGSMSKNTTVSFEGLPTDGSTLYVRLFTKVSTGWISSDTSYTCNNGSNVDSKAGQIYYPVNGDTLTGSESLFRWNPAQGALEYFLYMGNSVGNNDIYGRSQGMRTSMYMRGIPTDGRRLYVRLWVRTEAGWSYKDYTFRAKRRWFFYW